MDVIQIAAAKVAGVVTVTKAAPDTIEITVRHFDEWKEGVELEPIVQTIRKHDLLHERGHLTRNIESQQASIVTMQDRIKAIDNLLVEFPVEEVKL
jgi:hypothetical protein